jgi:hypothetical protein
VDRRPRINVTPRLADPSGDREKHTARFHAANTAALISGGNDMAFDYGLPAELFIAKRKGRTRISRRFATAAEAIRFAVEDFPAIRALGAWMKVGNERFDGEDIQRLYESHNFPQQRGID